MKMDKWLLFWTILMFVLGLFMILSASSVEASLAGDPYHYFVRQALILMVCAAATIFIITMPMSFFKKMSFTILIVVIGLLIFVFSYGLVVNRARSWIPLGFFNLQPSEFAKTAIILYMAVYYNKYSGSKNLLVILVPLIAAIAVVGFVFLQPDAGTALIITVLTAALFFSVPLDKAIKKTILQFAGLAVGIGVVFLLLTGSTFLKPGQLERFDYHNPCTKYLSGGSGYQVCNGLIAINNGGLWGVGLGNSTQKYLYLPEAHTDFIFPILLEELGLIAGVCILLVYFIIIYLIMRIAYRSYNLMGSIIAYGTVIYMFLHIAINLGGVLGIIPLTGVPLPFLSYGGSYALNLAILLALVQKVEIDNKKKMQKDMLRRGNLS